MFEYIFFYPQLAEEFAAWLQQQGVTVRIREDEDGSIVEVPDDLDDALDQAVDAKYEALLERSEEMLSAEREGEGDYHMAGITVQLSDGSVSYADIDPKLLGRVMQCVSPEEFSTLVDAIVSAVENPQGRSYCQRQREQAQD